MMNLPEVLSVEEKTKLQSIIRKYSSRRLTTGDDDRFVVACQKVRRRFVQNLNDYSDRRPSSDRKRYRQWRMRAEGRKTDPPPLRDIDVAFLALEDPALRVYDELRISARMASAFGALENRHDRPIRNRDLAPWLAARKLKSVFEDFNLPWTDYDSDELNNARGPAAQALRVVLGIDRNMRYLIRAAVGNHDT